MKWCSFLILVIILSSCKDSNQSKKVLTTEDNILSLLKNNVNPLFQNDQIKEAGKILDSLKPIVDKTNNYKIACAWLRFKSVQKEMEDKLDSAKFYADESLHLAKQKDSTQKDILGAKIQLANLLYKEKRYMEALQFGNDAYYLARKVDTLALPMVCSKLSHIYSALNDLPMYRRFLFEGYSRSVKPIHKIEFANNISRYYDEVGYYDSAVQFFKAVEKDTTIKSAYFDAVKFENLGINLTRLNNFKEGLQYQLKAAAINKKLEQMDALSYFNLAATYQELNQFDNALKNLDSALVLAKEDDDITLIKRIWHSKSSIWAALHEHAKANVALDSAYNYYSIEIDSSLAAQARELDTKYAIRDKDDQIKILAISSQANQKIRNQQKIIIIAIAVSILLLSIAALLLWHRRWTKMKLRETFLKQQLLRTQIEPHSLFHGLGKLQDLTYSGENEKAVKYLNSLAKLMRFNFDNARENNVLLRNEIEALESYLHLQALYKPGLFEYNIQIYEGYEEDDIFIPPMIFQPIVENSIEHGFSKIPYKGEIEIKIERRTNSLFCIIEDNGAGFQGGISNIKKHSIDVNKERLSILEKQTKQQASLKILDRKLRDGQRGVCVEIEIPFRFYKLNHYTH